MDQPSPDSPDISEFERLIDHNCKERKELIDMECQLRAELQTIIQGHASPEKFEDVRGREREARAALSRNLDQYDVLMEKWLEEASRIPFHGRVPEMAQGDRSNQRVSIPSNAVIRNAGLDLVPIAPTPMNVSVPPSGPGVASATFGSRLPEAPKPVFDYPLEAD
jgi:hypothetical protein